MQNLMLIMVNHAGISYRSLVAPPASNWKYRQIKGNRNTKIAELHSKLLQRLQTAQRPPVKKTRYINGNLINAAMQYACATTTFDPVPNAILVVDIENETVSVKQCLPESEGLAA